VLSRKAEFHEKDLWTFLEDSNRELKSFFSSNIEKIERLGGQQTLLRWGAASSGIRVDFHLYISGKGDKGEKITRVLLCV
jgi:hypothetical protein